MEKIISSPPARIYKVGHIFAVVVLCKLALGFEGNHLLTSCMNI
ncbi:MAG: hypothetical protein RR198_04680 [Oscillospiraceae bacterium]